MEFLQTIAGLGVDNLGGILPFIAVLTRVSVFVFLLPGLGETAISVRIRIVAALMVTFLVVPIISTDMASLTKGGSWGLSDVTVAIAREAFYGFVLGFGLRLMVFSLQITGAIISQSLSLTQVFGGGMTSEPNTSVGTILMMTGVTLLVTLDLHMRAIGLLVGTYDTFPLMQTDIVRIPDVENITYWMVEKAMSVFSFAVALALPFLVLNFIYNLILGFVNKAMPQLMVSFVGMPFITGVGIILLAMSVAGILTVWLGAYNSLLGEMA